MLNYLCMIVNKNLINFFLLIFFTLGVFFASSRIITHNTFPTYKKSHENIYQHYLNLKENQAVQKKMINSDDLCKNLSSKNITDTNIGYYRHSLRWVMDKSRIFYLEVAEKIGGKELLSFSFTFMIFLLITATFFLCLITINKKLFYFVTNNKNNYLILLAIFFFIISFYSFKTVSELRYSFFEMFFISASIYLTYIKRKLLFLITVILATLNRESGIIISSMWFIFNGINLKNKRLVLDNKEIIYGIFSVLTCLTILISLNFKLFSCGLGLSNMSLASQSALSGSIFRSMNIVFSNFILIILLFIFFYKNIDEQYKFLILAALYLLIFIVFTPADHDVLRILFAPIIMIYSNFYLKNFKDQ